MNFQRYSKEFKQSAVEKLLSRGSRRVTDIVDELGVPSPTLYQWRKEFDTLAQIKDPSQRPQDRRPEEKLKAVIEYENLPEEKRGEFLRREGLHSEYLRGWQKQMEEALMKPNNKRDDFRQRAEDRRKIKELERELRRKDKALAETTALLVLKKKADLIWGTGERE